MLDLYLNRTESLQYGIEKTVLTQGNRHFLINSLV